MTQNFTPLTPVQSRVQISYPQQIQDQLYNQYDQRLFPPNGNLGQRQKSITGKDMPNNRDIFIKHLIEGTLTGPNRSIAHKVLIDRLVTGSSNDRKEAATILGNMLDNYKRSKDGNGWEDLQKQCLALTKSIVEESVSFLAKISTSKHDPSQKLNRFLLSIVDLNPKTPLPIPIGSNSVDMRETSIFQKIKDHLFKDRSDLVVNIDGKLSDQITTVMKCLNES